MMRLGPSKPVDEGHWSVRLNHARTYRKAARDELALKQGDNANPIMSAIVLAAIAYADALTAKVVQGRARQSRPCRPGTAAGEDHEDKD